MLGVRQCFRIQRAPWLVWLSGSVDPLCFSVIYSSRRSWCLVLPREIGLYSRSSSLDNLSVLCYLCFSWDSPTWVFMCSVILKNSTSPLFITTADVIFQLPAGIGVVLYCLQNRFPLFTNLFPVGSFVIIEVYPFNLRRILTSLQFFLLLFRPR